MPMYCNVKKLDAFFNEARNQYPLETLINAADDVCYYKMRYEVIRPNVNMDSTEQ